MVSTTCRCGTGASRVVSSHLEPDEERVPRQHKVARERSPNVTRRERFNQAVGDRPRR